MSYRLLSYRGDGRRPCNGQTQLLQDHSFVHLWNSQFQHQSSHENAIRSASYLRNAIDYFLVATPAQQMP